MSGLVMETVTAWDMSRETLVSTPGALEGERMKFKSKHFCGNLQNIVCSECGGGVTKVSDISVEATISTVFAGLSLLASCLSVLTTVLFCKYR